MRFSTLLNFGNDSGGSGTFTRSHVALASAAILGFLLWALAPWLTGKKEAWDSGKYYYYSILIGTFVIALVCYRWKEVVAGLVVGQLLFFVTLKSTVFGGENIGMAAIALLFTLPVPLVGALAGLGLRWLISVVWKRRSH